MAVGAMGDVFVCFSCCVTQQPPRKRRRIDRSMIGLPTNFVHTGHVGAGDVTSNGNTPSAQSQLHTMENQMQTKGGYEHANSAVNVQLNCIDLKVDS